MKRRLSLVAILLSLWLAQPVAHAQSLLLLGAGGSWSAAAGTVARVFNGSSDVAANATAYLSGATSFTIAFWVKFPNLTQTNTYLVHERQNGGNGWALIWEFTNNTLEFFCAGCGGTDPSQGSSGVVFSDTNWHHVAWRYDGTHWDKFLDGTKTAISASTTFTLPTLSSTPYELSVGCQGNSAGGCNGNFAAAAVARVYISTAALSDGQLSALAGVTCSSSGVSGSVGYWLLAGASPEPESSPSPNTNSLALTGTTTTTGPTCSGS